MVPPPRSNVQDSVGGRPTEGIVLAAGWLRPSAARLPQICSRDTRVQVSQLCVTEQGKKWKHEWQI